MKKIPAEYLVFIFLSLCLAAYTFTRAAMISITHDEVGTYLGYSISPLMDIIHFKNLQLNNHLLNSLLVKLTTSIFGVSEFSMRLPNLAAHILYLIFAWKIIRLLTKDKFLMITGFILVNFNPYLLDFFSIARGYGLEISLMTMSIYFLMLYQQKNKPVYIWQSMFLSALGILANFTFITVYFSTIILVNIFLINKVAGDKRSFKLSLLTIIKHNLPIIIITAGLAALIAGPVMRLNSTGEFSGPGNNDGLWASLFRSVIRHSLYGQFRGDNIHIVFLVIAAIMLVLFGYFIYKDRWTIIRSRYFLLCALILITCLWFYLQHALLGSRYPQQRFALFIYPLYILAFITALDFLVSSSSLLSIFRSFMVILSVLVLVHFINSANATYYFDWKYDADTRKMLEENLGEMKKVETESNRQLVLGTYWLTYPSLIYYLMVKEIDWISLETYHDTFTKKADFYYVPAGYQDSLEKFNPVRLKDYPESGSVLSRQTGSGIYSQPE
jgi:hypothetical protein